MHAPLLSHLRLDLPHADGALSSFVLSEPKGYPLQSAHTFSRVAFPSWRRSTS